MEARKTQERLIVKRGPKFVALNDDVVQLALDVNGIIAAKEGKDTHVVASGKLDVPRSDGRIVTIQINAWYK